MNYKKVLPHEQLRKYVYSYSIMDSDESENSIKTFKSVVDTSPGILFLERPDLFSENAIHNAPHLNLHGLSTAYFEIKIKNVGKIISVNLKPNAIKAFFGIDAKEMTNKNVDLSNVCNTNLAEQLLNTESTENKIDIFNSFLLESLNKNKNLKIDKTNYALDFLQNENQEVSLKKLLIELNISERSLERMFMENVGISPKLFSRIIRFQKSLNNLRNIDSSKLTDIAFNNNYSDQSHFIREFKEFSGVTPIQYLKRSKEVIENLPELI